MELEFLQEKMEHTLELARTAHDPKIWDRIPEEEKANIKRSEAMVYMFVKQLYGECQDFLNEFEKIKTSRCNSIPYGRSLNRAICYRRFTYSGNRFSKLCRA